MEIFLLLLKEYDYMYLAGPHLDWQMVMGLYQHKRM